MGASPVERRNHAGGFTSHPTSGYLPPTMENLVFRLDQAPYSVRGSRFSFCWYDYPDNRGLVLRRVRRGLESTDIFRFELPEPLTVADTAVTPAGLRFGRGDLLLELHFATPSAVRFRLRGTSLRLVHTPRQPVVPLAERTLRTLHGDALVKTEIRLLKGRFRPSEAMVEIAAEDGLAEGLIVLFDSTPPADLPRLLRMDYAASADRSAEEFRSWLDRHPPLPGWETERAFAAYVNWSCLCRDPGTFTREAMLMSKTWMFDVWSWDHAFNAWAHVDIDPALAWDQFMLLFDRQDGAGCLPDCVGGRGAAFVFHKPPVHGWILSRMLRRRPDLLTADRLAEVLPRLEAWTRWWIDHMDSDGDGIPEYHFGYDSGWDNATVFDEGTPLESPDLAAFLVLQMEALADLERRRGSVDRAAAWAARAAATLKRLLDHSLRDGRLVALKSGSHAVVARRSCLPSMSLVLGRRLPEAVRRTMVEDLRRSYLTPWGVATEPPTSPDFVDDGYWRGPVWAPQQMILVDGLLDAAETELALEIARRFMATCRHAGRFAENFSALDGRGLRDPAYTWTSSVFLMFASLLVSGGTEAG